MQKKEIVRLESEDGVYQGEAINGIPNGKGKFVFTATGDMYEGEWVNNAQTGKGKYTWGDGDTYVGEFKDNMRHGFGISQRKDDAIYEGHFVDNLRCGKGKEIREGSTYDGEWSNDLRTGKGRITYADGSWYEGQWVDDMRWGVGCWRMSDGNTYEGEFVREKPHGKGEYHWADGALFMGYFSDGKRHGQGIERLANGDWLAGNWVHGQHDGKQTRHRSSDETIKVFTSTIKKSAGGVSPRATLTMPQSPQSVLSSTLSKVTSSEAPAMMGQSAGGDPNHGVPFEELARGATIGRLLGKGSFGSVFEAILPNGRVVALKVIELGSITGNEAEMASLQNEITLLSKFMHKNIVHLEGCVEDKDNKQMCIYMEYVPGGTLNSFMKKFPKLSPDIIRNWAVQILAGVAYLHENNVVHRDIKGDNILVGTDGVVKLADFGCSRSIDNLCSKTHGCRSMVGTPYWMAPEVIKDDSSGYGPKADVWSVGCTIVEMLTGKPPWPEFNSMWTAIYHIANSTGLPSEIPKDLAPEIMDFLLKTFERDASKRASARELLEHPWLKDIAIKYGYLKK